MKVGDYEFIEQDIGKAQAWMVDGRNFTCRDLTDYFISIGVSSVAIAYRGSDHLLQRMHKNGAIKQLKRGIWVRADDFLLALNQEKA